MSKQLLITAFDYGELKASDIKACETAVAKIEGYQRKVAASIIAIGKELAEVQAKLAPQKKFAPWLKHHFGWGQSSAYRMMEAAKMFGDLPNLGRLSIDQSALYLMSSDKCDDDTREELLERAQQGERITHAMVKDAITPDSPEDEDVPNDDDDDEDVADTWSPVECLSSIRAEIKRWLNVCPVEKRSFIQEMLEDIAAQIERRSNE